jgi:hypothetical protein
MRRSSMTVCALITVAGDYCIASRDDPAQQCALFGPVSQLDQLEHGGRFLNERLNQLNTDGRHGPDSPDPAHNWPARDLYFSK